MQQPFRLSSIWLAASLDLLFADCAGSLQICDMACTSLLICSSVVPIPSAKTTTCNSTAPCLKRSHRFLQALASQARLVSCKAMHSHARTRDWYRRFQARWSRLLSCTGTAVNENLCSYRTLHVLDILHIMAGGIMVYLVCRELRVHKIFLLEDLLNLIARPSSVCDIDGDSPGIHGKGIPCVRVETSILPIDSLSE